MGPKIQQPLYTGVGWGAAKLFSGVDKNICIFFQVHSNFTPVVMQALPWFRGESVFFLWLSKVLKKGISDQLWYSAVSVAQLSEKQRSNKNTSCLQFCSPVCVIDYAASCFLGSQKQLKEWSHWTAKLKKIKLSLLTGNYFSMKPYFPWLKAVSFLQLWEFVTV